MSFLIQPAMSTCKSDMCDGADGLMSLSRHEQCVRNRWTGRKYGQHVADVCYVDPFGSRIEKVVLLLHGYNSHAERWPDTFVAKLLSLKCRVVLVTYSDAFDSVCGAAWDVVHACLDAAKDALGQESGAPHQEGRAVMPWAIVGHSMGAMIAYEMVHLVHTGTHKPLCRPFSVTCFPLHAVVFMAGVAPMTMCNEYAASRAGGSQQDAVSVSERGYDVSLKYVLDTILLPFSAVVKEITTQARQHAVYPVYPSHDAQDLELVDTLLKQAQRLLTLYVDAGAPSTLFRQVAQRLMPSVHSALVHFSSWLSASAADLFVPTAYERMHAEQGQPLRFTALGQKFKVLVLAQTRAMLLWGTGVEANHSLRSVHVQGDRHGHTKYAVVHTVQDEIVRAQNVHALVDMLPTASPRRPILIQSADRSHEMLDDITMTRHDGQQEGTPHPTLRELAASLADYESSRALCEMIDVLS